jgi:hypothetical protein
MPAATAAGISGRHPGTARGSGSRGRGAPPPGSSRSPRPGIQEDVIGGRASPGADDGERENFHRSAQARPPPADTPHAPPVVTTPQVKDSLHDFAVPLGHPWRTPLRSGMWEHNGVSALTTS